MAGGPACSSAAGGRGLRGARHLAHLGPRPHHLARSYFGGPRGGAGRIASRGPLPAAPHAFGGGGRPALAPLPGRLLTPGPWPPCRLQGRLVSTITKEELESCFHMPSEQACRHLGQVPCCSSCVCSRAFVPRCPARRCIHCQSCRSSQLTQWDHPNRSAGLA